MAKALPGQPKLPPPGRGQVWAEFLKWALGVPLAVVAALAVIWAALWLTGSQGMMPKAESDMWGVLGWMGLIVLMYPVALVFLVWDLRDGLRAARDWEAMTPKARAAALQAAETDPPKRRKR
jgi:hypothetical protein